MDIAEQVNTLDAICGGCFILGVDLGYREEESQAFGVANGERLSRFQETLDIIRHLWTEQHWGIQGEHFFILYIYLTVRTVQRPHPPIWMAANSDAAIEAAARYPWLMNPPTLGWTPWWLSWHSSGMCLLTWASHYPKMRAYIAENSEAPFIAGKFEVYIQWGQDNVLLGNENF